MRWLVPEDQKLVAFLRSELSVSGKLLRRVLESNLCRVNGIVERFGTADVRRGDAVELAPTWQSILTPNLNSFETLFEDEHCLVVSKPAGWVCNEESCRKDFGPKHYLVHRLDKETTGALLIAKSTSMRDALITLFQERTIEKLYYAIVDGEPKEARGVSKSHFARIGTFEGQTIWGSRKKGLYAETHWKKLKSSGSASLLACQPITGRTHQIRVHLAEMDHPILVDRQYAKTYRCKFFASRPLLHARRVRFIHPMTGLEVNVVAEFPNDFASAIEKLGMAHTQDDSKLGR